MLLRALCIGIFAVAGCDAAEAVCPFINTATVSGILNGKPQVWVVPGPANSGDAVCEFALDSAGFHLRIQTNTMASRRTEFPAFVAQCGPNPIALRGIGSEAVGCAGTGKDGKLYYQVLSRVRERSLLVRLTSVDRAAAPLISEQARKVGEAVAGFLF
jgi:hypothetical protein